MPDRRSVTKGGGRQETADGYFGPLGPARYMLLTTFQPDGIPVSAYVHGAADGGRACFRAWDQSGTAKRLRHTEEVQVAPCPMPGLAVGPPLDAVARLLAGEEARWAARKLARKYPLHQRFLMPLLRWTRRCQLAYYELLSYEAAASQDVRQEAPHTADRHVHPESGRVSRRHQHPVNRGEGRSGPVGALTPPGSRRPPQRQFHLMRGPSDADAGLAGVLFLTTRL